MVRVIRGVRICSDEFPHSYELADKAKSIAIHFSAPIEDTLQELMYLELVNRKKTINNIKGYIISALYKNAHKRIWIDNNHAKRAKEMFANAYLTFDKEEMRNKMLVQELIDLLAGIDEALSELVVTIRDNVDDSLFQIYNCYYAGKVSQHAFYQRLKKIRKIAKKYLEEGFYMDSAGNLRQLVVPA